MTVNVCYTYMIYIHFLMPDENSITKGSAKGELRKSLFIIRRHKIMNL